MSFAAASKDLLFPTSGTILVTGSNGHVASNIIVEALALGFKVRGTVRNPDKFPVLDKLYNNPNYSSVVVEDFITPGAFDEAVKGVDAILLTATPLPGPADPNDIVPQTIAYAVGVAKSALASPTVKRIVWTGTIPIVFNPGVAYKQDRTTWADDAVKAAWAPPPYTPDRAWVAYKAAKDEAERALFEFAKKENAHYTVNSVLPCCVFGRIITKPSDTGTWPQQILNGTVPPFGGNGRTFFPLVLAGLSLR
jgi:nucleoside-diphosphate-sugar epimerase